VANLDLSWLSVSKLEKLNQKVRCTMLQILFLIGAWKRGWKAKALIPIGVAIAVVVVMAAAGVPVDGKEPVVLVPDVLSTIALAVMCAIRPASAKAPVVEIEEETRAETVPVPAPSSRTSVRTLSAAISAWPD
jgi:hypothetical protein